MPKLTVYFKDKVIQSGLFENGVVHIGRDETNHLIIDSLAVAPMHAAITIRHDSVVIKQLTNDFPININGKRTKEGKLKNNDTISIGKHDIVYKSTVPINQFGNLPGQSEDPINKDVISLNQEISGDLNIPDANLQVLDGHSIGKLIPLKSPITRLGHSGGVIIIQKIKASYFISASTGQDQSSIMLNNRLLSGETLKLNNQDVLIIDNTSLQFFRN